VKPAKRHVAIVGLMAAGKSTIGRRLARELGMEFVDTDALVVAATARSVAEIFAEEGEAGFRAHEFEAARRGFGGPPSVVAFGGGALTFAPTRELVARAAVRVYLYMEPRTILSRLQHSRTVRPLVGSEPTLGRVTELLAKREAFYREAEVVVSGEGRTAVETMREVVRRLEGYEFRHRPN
jgi:shikimate kinase